MSTTMAPLSASFIGEAPGPYRPQLRILVHPASGHRCEFVCLETGDWECRHHFPVMRYQYAEAERLAAERTDEPL